MRIFHLTLSAILIFLMSCTDGSEFGTVGKKLGVDGDSEEEEEDTDETVDEPTEIAGAFLYCAFWEDESEIEAKASNAGDIDLETSGSVMNGPEIACGFYKSDEPFNKVNEENLALEWSILANDKESAAATVPQKFNSNFHTIVRVPIDKTGGAIVGKVHGKDAHQPGYRMKDIASITESGAKRSDFDIKRHLRQNRELNLSLIITPPEQITAAGQAPGCDTACAIILGAGIVAEIIQPAAEPEMQEQISGSANSTSHDGHHRYNEVKPPKRPSSSSGSPSSETSEGGGIAETAKPSNSASGDSGDTRQIVSAGGNVSDQKDDLAKTTQQNQGAEVDPESGVIRAAPVNPVGKDGKELGGSENSSIGRKAVIVEGGSEVTPSPTITESTTLPNSGVEATLPKHSPANTIPKPKQLENVSGGNATLVNYITLIKPSESKTQKPVPTPTPADSSE